MASLLKSRNNESRCLEGIGGEGKGGRGVGEGAGVPAVSTATTPGTGGAEKNNSILVPS